MVEPSKTYRAWFFLSVYNSFQSNLVEVIRHQARSEILPNGTIRISEEHSVILFLRKARLDLGPSRDMQNRLVDHEETSAQRCFYHDAVVPINEESGRTKSGTLLAH